MKLKYLLSLLCLGFAFTLGSSQNFDTGYWYKISSKSMGDEQVLALSGSGKGGGPILTGKPGNNSQFWKLTHIGSGFYRLTNRATGNEMSLDIAGKKPNPLTMSGTGNFSGQLWRISDYDQVKGYYRMTTQKTKSGRSLTLNPRASNKMTMTKTADDDYQYWKFTKMDKITGKDLEAPVTSKKFRRLKAQKKTK